jgi:hypothetical protein
MNSDLLKKCRSMSKYEKTNVLTFLGQLQMLAIKSCKGVIILAEEAYLIKVL